VSDTAPSPAQVTADLPASSSALLEVSGLCKSLPIADGTVLEVSRDITFTLRAGEFMSIVGPSGAGKTTLLRIVSGLVQSDRGSVMHRGQAVRQVPSWLSVVFQEYNKSLFPWLTVRKNVMLAVHSQPRAEAQQRMAEALNLVGLYDFADRYPWELSGGMQQRVALARAMVSHPELLMMDEPFASVDALTRANLEDMVQRLWAEAGFAALLVTHDIAVARLLAHRIAVMQRGRVVETGLTDQVLDDPQHAYTQLLVSSVLQA